MKNKTVTLVRRMQNLSYLCDNSVSFAEEFEDQIGWLNKELSICFEIDKKLQNKCRFNEKRKKDLKKQFQISHKRYIKIEKIQ